MEIAISGKADAEDIIVSGEYSDNILHLIKESGGSVDIPFEGIYDLPDYILQYNLKYNVDSDRYVVKYGPIPLSGYTSGSGTIDTISASGSIKSVDVFFDSKPLPTTAYSTSSIHVDFPFSTDYSTKMNLKCCDLSTKSFDYTKYLDLDTTQLVVDTGIADTFKLLDIKNNVVLDDTDIDVECDAILFSRNLATSFTYSEIFKYSFNKGLPETIRVYSDDSYNIGNTTFYLIFIGTSITVTKE